MPKRFRLYQHPWLGMFAVMLTWVVALFICIIIATNPLKMTPGAQSTVFTTNLLAHITLLFVLVPFVLRLPAGKQSYKVYLDSIRLSRVATVFPTAALSAILLPDPGALPGRRCAGLQSFTKSADDLDLHAGYFRFCQPSAF